MSDKSSKNLTEDFYLTKFDPAEHFTLEDIFLHFPRLCGLGPEDQVPLEVLSLLTHPVLVALRSRGRSTLEDCAPSRILSKDSLVVDGAAENIQRSD